MKKIKKLVLPFVIVFLFLGCSVVPKLQNSSVIERYNELYDDNFYFVKGLNYTVEVAPDLNYGGLLIKRYRGEIYSDKLKENRVMETIPIVLKSIKISDLRAIGTKGRIEQKKNDDIKKEYAKRYFGPVILLATPYYATKVTVFVKDLENIDVEEYKKKTLDMANYIHDNINPRTTLWVDVRDDRFFSEYKMVYNAIVPPYRNEKDIKAILKKVKRRRTLTQKEKEKLLSVFYKNFYDDRSYKRFSAYFQDEEYIPIKVSYRDRSINAK